MNRNQALAIAIKCASNYQNGIAEMPSWKPPEWALAAIMEAPQHEPIQPKQAGLALQIVCHEAALESGWWHEHSAGMPAKALIGSTGFKYVVGSRLMLVVSEVAEAMEGHRKGLQDDKLPHRQMVEVELADAAIRIFDLAGALGLDIGAAIQEKLAYNAQRADHKVENRLADGGKAY